jgi:hypothetical protein
VPAPQERGARHTTSVAALRERANAKHKENIFAHTPRAQAAKITALQAAYRRKEAETPRDNAPSAEQIRTLGLLNRTDEEVNIFPAKFIPKITHMNGSRKEESS